MRSGAKDEGKQGRTGWVREIEGKSRSGFTLDLLWWQLEQDANEKV